MANEALLEVESEWSRRDERAQLQAAIAKLEPVASDAAHHLRLARAHHLLGDGHLALGEPAKGELEAVYAAGKTHAERALALAAPQLKPRLDAGEEPADALDAVDESAVP